MAFPSRFSHFLGNPAAVVDLRAALAAGRLPRSLILTGALGSGKYTLALSLALALECDRQPREAGPGGRSLADFCGTCAHCVRILEAADLGARVAEAVAAREEMRDTDKKDTRILVQTHPDVLIVPPDPPQLLIKLGQIRSLISRAHYVPSEGSVRVFIITSSAFMKEAANSLLKLLEEPPEGVYLILLAESLTDLLPTIRSRCAVVRLGSLPAGQIESLLADRRPQLTPKERALLGRLSEGAAGRALGFDLPAYLAARADALVLLAEIQGSRDHAPLFRMTEGYRAGAEGQQKLEAMLQALGRVLEDVLLLRNGAANQVRNIDLEAELTRLTDAMDLPALEWALKGIDAVRSGMRRNLLRSLSLDALALGLGGAPAGDL